MTFYTDQGTLQLLKHLTPTAAQRLKIHLETRAGQQYARIDFYAADFAGRTDVKQMKLERHETKTDVLVATVDMTTGVIWRRGSLRIPGVVLPETVRIAAKGRMIEEIVDGAPFSGFKINSLIQDGSGPKAKLRITCSAQEVGPITVNVAAAPTNHADDLIEQILPYAELNIDAVAERALRLMGRQKALTALLNLVTGKTHHIEHPGFRYDHLIEGKPGPHLAMPAASLSGVINLSKRKNGIRANVMVYIPGYNVAFMFDKSEAHVRLTKTGIEHKPAKGLMQKIAEMLIPEGGGEIRANGSRHPRLRCAQCQDHQGQKDDGPRHHAIRIRE